MPFKINISHKGKTFKIETESEVIVGKKIGEIIKGEDIANNLDGYELEITGTSDKAGLPGFKGLEGSGYHRRLLTFGTGMKNRKKGIRLRKTNRGEEISLKTSQINTKLIKEGKTKFNDLFGKNEGEVKEEKKEEVPAEKPKEEKVEETKPVEKPVEETKEEKEEEKKE
jgi:ribosomal protein S6E (S10)